MTTFKISACIGLAVLLLGGCSSTGAGASARSSSGTSTGAIEANPIFPQSTERQDTRFPEPADYPNGDSRR